MTLMQNTPQGIHTTCHANLFLRQFTNVEGEKTFREECICHANTANTAPSANVQKHFVVSPS